jgi:hypothetical protein
MSVDFNSPIDISKLSETLLDLPEEALIGQVETMPKKKGRPHKATSGIESQILAKKASKSKAAKEHIPKYTPKSEAKQKAFSGQMKKGEYRGVEALSEEDKRFIEEHARKIPVNDIAEQLGKRRISVFKYMDQHGLLSDDDKRDSRIKRAILNDLHNQGFWKTILKGYTSEEIEFFEEYWCAFVIQMDDNVAATEQMQLCRLIETQISINRLTISERKILDEAERIEEEIQYLRDKLLKEEDEDEILFLKNEIANLTTSSAATALLNKTNIERDKDILVKAHGKLMEALDVTRVRRVEKYDVSDRTWAKMLMEIKENPRLKKQMSAMSYISYLAVERMRSRLTLPYVFADGTEQPPMLLPEGCVNNELREMVEVLHVPQVEGTV